MSELNIVWRTWVVMKGIVCLAFLTACVMGIIVLGCILFNWLREQW